MPITKPGEIPHRFGEAWNRYDASALADLFYGNADFVNVVGLWWDNKEEIQKAHDYGFRKIFGSSHFEVLRVKVKPLEEHIAIVHARIRIIGQTRNKVENPLWRETMFLFVARRSNGQWLVESAQNTDIALGGETNIRDEKGRLMPVSYQKKNHGQRKK